MNDGTTGFQVAPITEDDMSKVQSILKRAMDGMIGLSQLAADVDMLRQTVSGLQADTDRLRNQNAALDEALAHSRTVRDDQAQTISGLASKLDAMTQERDEHKSRAEYNITEVDRLSRLLREAQDDRDGFGFKAMDYEDQLKVANDKLAKLAQAHADVFGAMQPTPPQPPHPIQAVDEVKPYDPKPYDPKPQVNTTDRYLPDGTYNPDYIPF